MGRGGGGTRSAAERAAAAEPPASPASARRPRPPPCRLLGPGFSCGAQEAGLVRHGTIARPELREGGHGARGRASRAAGCPLQGPGPAGSSLQLGACRVIVGPDQGSGSPGGATGAAAAGARGGARELASQPGSREGGSKRERGREREQSEGGRR